MAVNVTRPEGRRAEITWDAGDDAKGYLVQSIDSEQLAFALEAIAASPAGQSEPTAPEEYALSMAAATANLARLLERRTAVQVVQLRDHYGLSWRRIALSVLDDADKQSSVRRMYESGRRHLGT
ncbi:hypothetical protein ACFWJY_00595 [Streptomyces anulatus]|uniref:hypothetical protein n=1 Tax=Streptomyces anulatus TaxID=1892 RepID=UPI0036537CAC